VALHISLLELSIKEHTAEQQEKLCKEFYYDNPLKFLGQRQDICKDYFAKL